MGIARTIPVGVTGVGFLGVWRGEEGIVEDYGAEFGREGGEKGRGRLGVYVVRRVA